MDGVERALSELMRAALAIRRGETPETPATSATSATSATPATPATPAAIDDAFVRAVRRPRHGRINVVVFAQLAREFDLEARAIWDVLFPPRGKSGRGYRND